MADAGSFLGNRRDFYWPADRVNPSLHYLVAHGYIKESKVQKDFYVLSLQAQHIIFPCTRLAKRVLLANFCRVGVAPEKMSLIELIQTLTNAGWTEEIRVRGRDIPYTPGSRKIWVRLHDKKPSANYLRVLLDSDKLFQLGLKGISHLQLEAQLGCIMFSWLDPVSARATFMQEIDVDGLLLCETRYYLCILNCPDKLPEIEPNKPSIFYKDLMGSKNSSKLEVEPGQILKTRTTNMVICFCHVSICHLSLKPSNPVKLAKTLCQMPTLCWRRMRSQLIKMSLRVLRNTEPQLVGKCGVGCISVAKTWIRTAFPHLAVMLACKAMLKGQSRSGVAHSESCRSRLEKAMATSAEGRSRLAEQDERANLFIARQIESDAATRSSSSRKRPRE